MQLTGADGKQIVSTRNMPAPTLLPESLSKEPAKPAFAGPFPLGGDMLAVAFRMPVFSVQANPGEGPPSGELLAVAPLDDRFFQLLQPPVPSSDGSESVLVKIQDGTTTRYSAKATGTPQPTDASHDDSIAMAIAHPGQMISARNGMGRPAFAFAAPVEGTPGWWLIRGVDRNMALAEAAQRAWWWRVSYLLGVGLLTAAGIAYSRNQSALRSKEAAHYYRQLAHRIEQQEQMLTLIAETTPVSTFIVDIDNRFRYANRKAAEEFHMERSDIEGKTLASVLGTARAEEIATANRAALDKSGSHRSMEEEITAGMPIRFHRSRTHPAGIHPARGRRRTHAGRTGAGNGYDFAGAKPRACQPHFVATHQNAGGAGR